MNADAFRHFFNYHFAENRNLWESYIVALPQEQYTRPFEYSIGSIRNHLAHLMNVDNAWFSGLRGADFPEEVNPEVYNDRATLRAHWDIVEQHMRDYLAQLRDETLLTKPFTLEEDKNLVVWQVLLQVVNHGTDHRAQVRRVLHDFGVKTAPQDYIFYVYDHP